MASVASCCCSCSSTVFASSSYIPYRISTPGPSLRPPPRRARLPGSSVLRCLPRCDSEKPLLAKGTEPASRGRAAPLDASCGFAFAAVAGVLMHQGSQQALAGTQFMGLQPADVLGDLGDISTGFSADLLF